MKVKKLEKVKNKIGLRGCKCSSLNAQGTDTPQYIIHIGSWENSPFSLLALWSGVIRISIIHPQIITKPATNPLFIMIHEYGYLGGACCPPRCPPRPPRPRPPPGPRPPRPPLIPLSRAAAKAGDMAEEFLCNKFIDWLLLSVRTYY